MASYSPVYSSQFIVRPGDQPIVPFVVPDGFTAIVRDFSIFSFAVIGGVQLLIQNSAEAEQMTAAFLSLEAAPGGAQWQGRIVLPAPGILGAQTTSVGLSIGIYAGGYLLRNVAA